MKLVNKNLDVDKFDIIEKILSDSKNLVNPPGWRRIKKAFGISSGQAKEIAAVVKFNIERRIVPKITINTPKIEWKRESKRTAFILCSDWHIGEIVDQEEVEINKYNVGVAHKRVFDFLCEIQAVLKETRPEEVILVFLGDIVSGTIHHEIENQTGMMDQLSAASYLCGMLIEATKPDKVVGCYGNHGEVRTGSKKKKSKSLQNNFDLLLYKLVSLITGVDMVVSKSPFILFSSKAGNVLATHGDHINSWQGIPVYGIFKKQLFIHNLCEMKGEEKPRLTMLAHFHEPQNVSQFGERVVINGTLMGINEYAFRKGMLCTPSQKIVLLGKNHFAEYIIELGSTEELEIPQEAALIR